MAAYYNEIDPYAVRWLRNLIAAGHIAPGDVDERSIEDVHPADLAGYAQCHFFAGIGVWSYALRRAGWPDERGVWTGSCPCQPFSQAGKGDGVADERHLWPAFDWLIGQCRPPVVLGEQVASPAGLAWLDLVSADMETAGYTFAAADLCAAGVGAPHIRQRLWWVANTRDARSLPAAFGGIYSREEGAGARNGEPERYGAIGLLGNANVDAGGQGRTNERGRHQGGVARSWPGPRGASGAQQLADAGSGGSATRVSEPRQWQERVSGEHDNRRRELHGRKTASASTFTGPVNGFWRDADWLFCRDGKWRPVEPGAFPLAHGAPARVGRLRAYGNAINAEVAETFIRAVMEVAP